MAIITLRQANVVTTPGGVVKGSPLTNSEVDNNFANVNVELSDLGNTVAGLSTFEISNANTRLSITVADGPLNLTGNIIPTTSNVFNLGNTTNRFKDLFLSGTTIDLGGVTIKAEDGFIKINDNNAITINGDIASANVRLLSGDNFIELKANAELASNLIFNFPIADGSAGQALVTDAAGNLSFAAAGATLTDDTSTNSSFFPVITSLTSGALTTASVSSSKLFYNPSTGKLTTTAYAGNGADLTNLDAGDISAGTLSVERGGTGATASTGSGSVVLANSPTLVTPALGTPSSANLISAVGLPIVGGTTGTLSVARGGTGTGISATNGQLLIGNGSGFTLAGITGTANRVTVTNGSGTITLSGPQDLATSSDVQFDSFGVGTAASGTTGEIRATNNITAFFSDRRLKTGITPIANALNKICNLNGVTFQSNDIAAKYGYTNQKVQVGVIAQEVKEVLPQVVVAAPFDIGQNEDGSEYSISGENYLTVHYEKLVPLLIEAIKELKTEVDQLKNSKG